MVTIIEDTRQQAGKHRVENAQLRSLGVNLLRSKLPCGDYAVMTNLSVVVDSKKDMQEIVGNICGKQHDRFRRELQLAQENSIKLIILFENADGITCVEDVFKWQNPRLKIMKNSQEVIGFYRNGRPKYKKVPKYPRATSGKTLAKAMLTMEAKYGVEFKFCQRSEAGKRILELLGVDMNEVNETT
jgi:ribosome-associated protein